MMRSVYDEDCLNHHVVLGRSASVTWTVHRIPSARAPPDLIITDLIINWTDLIIN